MNNRINYINEYLKNKFSERTLKICIDGGFTCPNRDGTKAKGGCIFCSERGSGEHLSQALSIKEQVSNALNSVKIERANSFILYFQNYTNTYKPINELKELYDEAIESFEFTCKQQSLSSHLVGIQIATRPDCINEDIAKLLASYKDKLYVAVELGLQTINDDTNFLNRCYTTKDFEDAVKLLNKYEIDVIAHIMVGLPKKENNQIIRETHEDIKNTIEFINTQNIQGLKIHSCYVVKNTYLEQLYNEAKFTPLSLDEYLEELTYILTHISPNIVVHRISGDAPKDILVAPAWNTHKKWVLNGIYKIFNEQDLWQGKFYNQHNI